MVAFEVLDHFGFKLWNDSSVYCVKKERIKIVALYIVIQETYFLKKKTNKKLIITFTYHLVVG